MNNERKVKRHRRSVLSGGLWAKSAVAKSPDCGKHFSLLETKEQHPSIVMKVRVFTAITKACTLHTVQSVCSFLLMRKYVQRYGILADLVV